MSTVSPQPQNQTTTTINNVVEMSYSKRFEVVGGIIAIKKIEEYTYLCEFFSGDQGSSAISSLQSNYDILQNFTIDGELIENARIKNIEEVKDNDYNKKYKIVIEKVSIADDLKSLGSNFADFTYAFTANGGPINEISESISVSKSDNSTSISRQINIQFTKNATAAEGNAAVDLGEAFIDKIAEYDKNTGYSAIVPSITLTDESSFRDILTGAYRRFKTKEIDLVNGRCSITTNLQASNIKSNASYEATLSIQLNKLTEVTVSEQGKIQLLLDSEFANAKSSLQSKFDAEKLYIKARLTQAVADSEACSGIVLLETDFFESEEITFDLLAGFCQYNVSVIGRLNNEEPSAGIRSAKITEKTIANKETIETTTATLSAKGGVAFDPTQIGIARYPKYKTVFDYFNMTGKNDILKSSSINGMVSHSQTHSLFEGTIQWNVSYSDLEKYDTDDEKIKMLDIVTQISQPVTKSNVFYMPKNRIVQKKKVNTTTEKSATLSAILRKGSFPRGFSLSSYNHISPIAINKIKTKLNATNGITKNFSESMTALTDLTYTCSLSAEILE